MELSAHDVREIQTNPSHGGVRDQASQSLYICSTSHHICQYTETEASRTSYFLSTWCYALILTLNALESSLTCPRSSHQPLQQTWYIESFSSVTKPYLVIEAIATRNERKGIQETVNTDANDSSFLSLIVDPAPSQHLRNDRLPLPQGGLSWHLSCLPIPHRSPPLVVNKRETSRDGPEQEIQGRLTDKR